MKRLHASHLLPFIKNAMDICHVPSFRALNRKMQVFFYQGNIRVTTRMDHAVNVAATAFMVACALQCDTYLAYAIGLGHDHGHPPFGHVGEIALNAFARNFGGFHHEQHSLRGGIQCEKCFA